MTRVRFKIKIRFRVLVRKNKKEFLGDLVKNTHPVSVVLGGERA